MRRFLTYFNALLLGVILGMIFLTIIYAIPADRSREPRADDIAIGQKTLAISMSLVRCVHKQSCALTK